MKRLVVPIAIAFVVLITACGDGDSSTPAESTARAKARATVDAAIERAEELGVTDEARAYAKQWCGPLTSLFDEFASLSPALEAAEDSEDIGTFLEVMDVLEGPLESFMDDLEDMDPPEEYEAYHFGFQAQIRYALEAIRLIEEGGLFAAFALGDEPPEVAEPPELESAFAIECGEEFLDILGSDEFGEFFRDGESSVEVVEEPLDTGPGSSRGNTAPLGATVQTPDDREVRVARVDFAAWPVVQAANQFNDPPPEGKRMLLVTVEVTYSGTGDETVFVSSNEFALTGSRNVVYDSFDDGVYCGSIPNALNAELFSGGTAAGNVCFQYPEDETDLILIVEPAFSFDSSDRRYLALD